MHVSEGLECLGIVLAFYEHDSNKAVYLCEEPEEARREQRWWRKERREVGKQSVQVAGAFFCFGQWGCFSQVPCLLNEMFGGIKCFLQQSFSAPWELLWVERIVLRQAKSPQGNIQQFTDLAESMLIGDLFFPGFDVTNISRIDRAGRPLFGQ